MVLSFQFISRYIFCHFNFVINQTKYKQRSNTDKHIKHDGAKPNQNKIQKEKEDDG